LVGGRGFKLVPRLATNQTLCEFLVMYEPPPLKEVKIFRALRTGVEDFFWYVK
jgi:hypothetical protein